MFFSEICVGYLRFWFRLCSDQGPIESSVRHHSLPISCGEVANPASLHLLLDIPEIDN